MCIPAAGISSDRRIFLVVVPIHNEEPSLLRLYDRLTAVLEPLRQAYEILFIDDASTDGSFELLANLVETDAHLKVIRLRRNFGQSAALSAGFHEAKGDIIIAMTAICSTPRKTFRRCSLKLKKATISPAAGARIGWIMR